jgi:large subunit ribosomal protein L6
MSRVGKKPVAIPKGVTAKVDGQKVSVKGAKGELFFVVPDEVDVSFANDEVKVTARALWGTSRAQVNNLVVGVSTGFTRKLDITGVGYKASVQGKILQLSLGYSHDVPFPIPEGITIVTPKPIEIIISGIDKRQVGQVASEIRAHRPPEPYKGKGVRYSDEFIFRKEGKKK